MDTMQIAALVGSAAAAAALAYLAGCMMTRKRSSHSKARVKSLLDTIDTLNHSLTTRDEAHAETLMKARLRAPTSMAYDNAVAEREVEQAYHRADVAELESTKEELVETNRYHATNLAKLNHAINRIASLKLELDATEATLQSARAALARERDDSTTAAEAVRGGYRYHLLRELHRLLDRLPDHPHLHLPISHAWRPVIEARNTLRAWDKQRLASSG